MDPLQYQRLASAADHDQAHERITLAYRLGVIDADECAGRLAHLAQVRTFGELAAVLADLPPLAQLWARQQAAPGWPSPPPRPGSPSAAGPAVVQPVPPAYPGSQQQPAVRLPLTSPGRADAPPPQVPYGPYGNRFAGTDPRTVSHRVVPRVVPTAWGPTWQLAVVRQTNRWAVTSLVLGIASIVIAFCLPIGLIGAVAGHLALHQIRLSDDAIDAGTVVAVGEQPQTGRGMAIAGLVLSYLGFLGWGVLLTLVIVRANT